ncbi:MAG: penicillin-binding protein 1C, partial [Thermodesulfobacteriota bacterium]
PDLPGGRLVLSRSRQVAWKTGTSYGYRDAWAIGATDDYTVGVWVGRPDGTPSPGQYGRATAAPLLFTVVDSLPRRPGPPPAAPPGVERTTICWPLGLPSDGPDDPLCHQRRTAWTLDEMVPPTLPDRADGLWQANPLTVLVNPATGLRVEADCPVYAPRPVTIARWPRAAGPWLSPHQRNLSRIPPLDPVCGRLVANTPAGLRIMEIEPGTVFRPPGAETDLPTITLQALGGQGLLFWMLDGELIAEAGIGQTRFHRFQRPGRFMLTVMDQGGDYDSVEIMVLAGNPDS